MKDLLFIQVLAGSQLVANKSARVEEIASTDHKSQSKDQVGSVSSIVRKLLEKVVGPKPPQTIHSGTINKEERHGTLASFAMPGIVIGQVDHDYEAFFKTAWGSSPTPAPRPQHRPINIDGGRVRAFSSEGDLKEKPNSSRSPLRSPQLRKAKQPLVSSALVQPHSQQGYAKREERESKVGTHLL